MPDEPKPRPLTTADVQAMIERAVKQGFEAGRASAVPAPSGAPKTPKECDCAKPPPATHEVASLCKRLRNWGAQLTNTERDTLLIALADKAGL